MKGTVTNCQNSGTWEGHGKVFNLYEITIGEHTGQYMSNKYMDKDASDFPFKVGTECEYEYVAGDHPKIKLPKKEFNASNGSGGSNASYALSYAKDVLVASWMSPKEDTLQLSTEQMFALADKMNEYLNSK